MANCAPVATKAAATAKPPATTTKAAPASAAASGPNIQHEIELLVFFIYYIIINVLYVRLLNTLDRLDFQGCIWQPILVLESELQIH